MIIDTEGYELNVLKGGIKTIINFSPIIIMEIHKKKDLTSRYGYNKVESYNFLRKLNIEKVITPKQQFFCGRTIDELIHGEYNCNHHAASRKVAVALR